MGTAYWLHEYDKGFVLTEESFFKIHNLINKRLSGEKGNQTVTFELKTRRTDGQELEYKELRDLVQEDNSPHNQIKQVVISAESIAGDAKVDFNAGFCVSVIINAEKRDVADLLFTELKQCLNHEVFKNKWLEFGSPESIRVFGYFVPVIILPVIYVLLHQSHQASSDQSELAHVLASKDVVEKLNYIITGPTRRPDTIPFLYGFVGVAIFAAFWALIPILRWLSPRNIFAWGAMATILSRRAELRKNLIWGVFVAGFVGLIVAAMWDHIKVI